MLSPAAKTPRNGCLLIWLYFDESALIQCRAKLLRQVRRRIRPDLDEDAVQCDLVRTLESLVEPESADFLIPENLLGIPLENEDDIVAGFDPVHPIGFRAKCIAAMDQIHLFSDLRRDGGSFDGAVPPPITATSLPR